MPSSIIIIYCVPTLQYFKNYNKVNKPTPLSLGYCSLLFLKILFM